MSEPFAFNAIRNAYMIESQAAARRFRSGPFPAGRDDAVRDEIRCVERIEDGATQAAAVQREGISHYRRSHVGHGIGLDGYDLPALTQQSTDTLEAGMVLSVETPYYELGWCGLQVEDMVVVTSKGVESFMNTSGEVYQL